LPIRLNPERLEELDNAILIVLAQPAERRSRVLRFSMMCQHDFAQSGVESVMTEGMLISNAPQSAS